MADDRRDDSSTVPRWNGDPAGFKRWQQEVRIFKLRKDLNKELSYAAELVVGLSGAARTAALQLDEESLWPYDTIVRERQLEAMSEGDDGGLDPHPSNREVNLKAIDNLVRRLEAELMQSKPVQRGAMMASSSRLTSATGAKACA